MGSFFSSSFPLADHSAWLAQVQRELKDAGAYESIRWHTDEGFTLEPYYTADDLNSLPLSLIQGAQKQLPGWINAPEYIGSDEKTTNAVLRDALTKGADGLIVRLPAKPDLSQLLNGIKLTETPVYFAFQPGHTPKEIVDVIQSLKTIAPYQLKGGILTDTGEATSAITRLAIDSPQFYTVGVSSRAFHNAGATATQELAFTLASLADRFDQLTDAGLPINQLAQKLIVSVSVGTSYFVEIAKLRALRVLVQRFFRYYQEATTTDPIQIHARTSTFYDSTATTYTNMIRATTEAMAAIIGGCDVLSIHAYDTVLNQPSEFSERIARHVSILLNEEAHLGKVADPSAGSYYVENLTYQLVETAWALFVTVEKRGGLAKTMADGYVQAELERSYQTKVEAIKDGCVLVGVNKFRFDEPTTQSQPIRSEGMGVAEKRLAEPFE
ncbi:MULTISPECIES: methylmalonyl-CoA mutase family protein [unclassified Spirosoma]|uniref:methylmalonyl-CoA mutase family protein n=1 Tax=unclassified Spirosoma TaxID=2621999 RepID=UPI00095F9268|nr:MULTISPECIES: methylmalonyl-CoA mutase family protein [unclassified Spirosoma]MBN8826303.1 methylmalonyl-CoA mutase [Spirosoma sp.]OJW75201.1 MAG: methylmalonyl-CoA mutase [Spirosoma sp. 48-14]